MENKDIEIVQEEKEGLSIGDIFRRIWHAKITLGISFVVSAIVIALGIQYLYTKPKEVYNGSITYQFRGAAQGLYPNGTGFDYRTIVEPSALRKIKASNPDFESIDVEKMIEKNAIKVTQATRDVYNEEGETVPTVAPNYINIECSASYFDNEAQARSFILAVLEAPNTLADSLYDLIVYDQNLQLAESALTYESQYGYLINQRDFLISNYNELMSIFGEMAVMDGNATTTVSQELTRIQQFFLQYNLSDLQSEARLKNYIKSEESTEIDKLQIQLDQLVDTYNLNVDKIRNLKQQWAELLKGAGNVIINSNEFLATIHDLTISNTDLLKNIKDLAGKLKGEASLVNDESNPNLAEAEKYVQTNVSDNPILSDNMAPESYKQTLATITSNLETYTTELKETTTYLYLNYANPIYELPSQLELSGGLNIIFNLAISVVLGAIIACVIAGIKGNIDIKKEIANKQKVVEEETAE